MRAPTFRSPIVLALAAFVVGLIVKRTLNVGFSIGGTMVVVLWLPLLIVIALNADFFPDRSGHERHSWYYFLSRENWLELLAVLALPGVGFAVDAASLTLSTAALAAIGVVGIVACVLMGLHERKKRDVGYDL